MQEWVKAHRREDLHRVRGPRHRRQGRHDQGDHRARQPARVPRRRAARADRAREVADVHPALHAALPRRGRGRDLRSQLVQPRRRRARHGLLHARSRPSGSSSRLPPGREGDGRLRDPACSSTGSRSAPEEQTRRLESRIDDPRKIWKLSAMDLQVVQRWDDYSARATTMFEATDTRVGAVVSSRTPTTRSAAGSTSSRHLLDAGALRAARAPHEIKLPEARRRDGGYVEPERPRPPASRRRSELPTMRVHRRSAGRSSVGCRA